MNGDTLPVHFCAAQPEQNTTDWPVTRAGNAIPDSVMLILESTPFPGTSLPARALNKTLTTLSLIPLLPGIARFFLSNRPAAAQPRIVSFMTALRTANPTTKIGAAGFCWGGLFTILLTHDTPQNTTKVTIDDTETEVPLIDCGFTAHPSWLDVPTHIEGVVRPLSVANGDDDQYLGKEKMKLLTEILERKNTKGGAQEERFEVVVYPGAKHGFVVRGDLGDPLQKERGEKSEEQAVRWFRRWFER
jgi:dienelactone hydrolase